MRDRDPDAIQSHEAAQQRLVETIIQSFHKLTSEDDEYWKKFACYASVILNKLADLEQRPMIEVIEVNRLAMQQIWNFTKEETERRYLLGHVLEKLVASVTSRTCQAYLNAELTREATG